MFAVLATAITTGAGDAEFRYGDVAGALYLWLGRAKRFAKLGGEMISLAAERIAEAAIAEARHPIVALPDPRRGEKLILVTEAHGFERGRLIEAARRLGMPEIAVPREIIEIERMPLLGTGKTDYAAVTRLAERTMAAPPPEMTPAERDALSLVRDLSRRGRPAALTRAPTIHSFILVYTGITEFLLLRLISRGQ
jgi:hypothetical protein